jgi:hypothetical protein
MTTTVKVKERTRDRLKAGAQGFRTMDGYLNYLLDQDQRRRDTEALKRAIEATSPQDMTSWQAEAEAWERTQA